MSRVSGYNFGLIFSGALETDYQLAADETDFGSANSIIYRNYPNVQVLGKLCAFDFAFDHVFKKLIYL